MLRAFVSTSKVNEKNSCWHEISFSMEDRVHVGFYFLSGRHSQDRKDRLTDSRRRENAATTVVAYTQQQDDYQSTTTQFSLERCFHAGGFLSCSLFSLSFFKNTDRGMEYPCLLCFYMTQLNHIYVEHHQQQQRWDQCFY